MRTYANYEHLIQVVPNNTTRRRASSVLSRASKNLSFHLRGLHGWFLRMMLVFGIMSATMGLAASSAKEIFDAIGPAGVIVALFSVGFLGALIAQGVIKELKENNDDDGVV
jgi:hypothetical protein